MAEKKTRGATASTAAERGSGELTDEERAAMQERAREAKRSGKATPAEEEAAVVEKIAGMAPPDRAIAERVHALVKAAAPGIAPKLWYGMPAYAIGGKTICHFQDAAKFKTRYATLGFSDAAKLDDGAIWPVAFALLELTPEVEARITELVKRATS